MKQQLPIISRQSNEIPVLMSWDQKTIVICLLVKALSLSFAKGYVQAIAVFWDKRRGGGILDWRNAVQKVRLRPTDQLLFNSPTVQQGQTNVEH